MANTAEWSTELEAAPAESGLFAAPPPSSVRPRSMNDSRLRGLVDAHYASVWRLVRRLGVDESAVDDAVQEIFWVAARRLDEIQEGSERSFLYGVALRTAATARRRCRSLREVPFDVTDVEALPAPVVDPDALLDQHRARALLDELLDRLPEDLRTVLVLHELEGLQVKQIAELVSIPVGTAGSRLRRAREAFSGLVKVVRARLEFAGENP